LPRFRGVWARIGHCGTRPEPPLAAASWPRNRPGAGAESSTAPRFRGSARRPFYARPTRSCSTARPSRTSVISLTRVVPVTRSVIVAYSRPLAWRFAYAPVAATSLHGPSTRQSAVWRRRWERPKRCAPFEHERSSWITPTGQDMRRLHRRCTTVLVSDPHLRDGRGSIVIDRAGSNP
jgi:hypothetical protein